MSKKTVTGPRNSSAESETKDPGSSPGRAKKTSAGKGKKGMGVSKMLHLEIARGNWKRLAAYIDAYNADPNRRTPKIAVSHVVNQALVKMLGME